MLIEALADTPVLKGITEPALQLLADEGIIREYVPNDLIVVEGEFGRSLFILIEGDVEVVKHYSTARAVTLAQLHSRNFFGEMCVVDPIPRGATVRAISNVTAIEIKATTLYRVFQQMPGQYTIVLLNLARDMARRLSILDEAFAARSS